MAKKDNKRHKKKEREAVFHPEFREDLKYWVETDRKAALRALELVEAILRDSFIGIGKPEPLKYLGTGVWSVVHHRFCKFVELVVE